MERDHETTLDSEIPERDHAQGTGSPETSLEEPEPLPPDAKHEQINAIIAKATQITLEHRIRWREGRAYESYSTLERRIKGREGRAHESYSTKVGELTITTAKWSSDTSTYVYDERGNTLAYAWSNDPHTDKQAVEELWQAARDNALETEQKLDQLMEHMEKLDDATRQSPEPRTMMPPEPKSAAEAAVPRKGLIRRLLGS